MKKIIIIVVEKKEKKPIRRRDFIGLRYTDKPDLVKLSRRVSVG